MTEPGWLEEDAWQAIQRSVPIPCVDLVPFRRAGGRDEVGLVLRHTPFGEPRWCHLGGRVNHGETVRAALLRHLHATLDGVTVELPADPQPTYVMQWFPEPVEPARDGVAYGWDPRRHAIALCFAVRLDGAPEPVPGGEGLRFGWFGVDEVARMGGQLWPGTAALVATLSDRVSPATRPAS